MQYDDAPAGLACQLFQTPAQIQFLGRETFSLNPPSFRKTAASTKMNEPASQRPIRLEQFQSQVKNSAIKCFSSIRTVSRRPASGRIESARDLVKQPGSGA